MCHINITAEVMATECMMNTRRSYFDSVFVFVSHNITSVQTASGMDGLRLLVQNVCRNDWMSLIICSTVVKGKKFLS